MNIPNTSRHLDERDPLPTGSPNEVMSDIIGRGIAKTFDVHFASTEFMAELAETGFAGLGALHLLNEMMSYWADPDPETLHGLSPEELAAVEMACWAWAPFYRSAMMLEEQGRARAGAN